MRRTHGRPLIFGTTTRVFGPVVNSPVDFHETTYVFAPVFFTETRKSDLNRDSYVSAVWSDALEGSAVWSDALEGPVAIPAGLFLIVMRGVSL